MDADTILRQYLSNSPDVQLENTVQVKAPEPVPARAQQMPLMQGDDPDPDYVFIDVPPTGKARPRTFTDDDGKSKTVMPLAYRKRKTAIKRAWGNRPIPTGTTSVRLIAVYKRPKSGKNAHKPIGSPCDKTPDLDNVLGTVMDALLPNDSGVAFTQCLKVWGHHSYMYVSVTARNKIIKLPQLPPQLQIA